MAGGDGGDEGEEGWRDTAAGREISGDAAEVDGDCATAGDWNWSGASRESYVDALRGICECGREDANYGGVSVSGGIAGQAGVCVLGAGARGRGKAGTRQ